MVTLLTILFVILCFLLLVFILLQQGKGDMGLGGMGGGGQMLFGGSGGQEFFERTTWIMVSLFIIGSLGIAILRSRAAITSRLEQYQKETPQQQSPTKR